MMRRCGTNCRRRPGRAPDAKYAFVSRLSIAVACALIPGVSGAQSDTSARATSSYCWRGKPLPQCRSFLITEMAGEYAFAATRTRYTLTSRVPPEPRSVADEGAQLLWRVGPMFNTSPSRAIGVTLSAGTVIDGGREAIELRQRRWINTGNALDVSAGALRMDIPKSPQRPTGAAYGVTTGIYLVGGDLIHVDGHADLVIASNRVRGGGTVGGGLGGFGAVGGTVLLGALALAVLIAFANADF
jgi:hypothetical protein